MTFSSYAFPIGLVSEPYLNVALGGPAMVIDDANKMSAVRPRPPRQGALAYGQLTDQSASVEPKDIADVGSHAGFQGNHFIP